MPFLVKDGWTLSAVWAGALINQPSRNGKTCWKSLQKKFTEADRHPSQQHQLVHWYRRVPRTLPQQGKPVLQGARPTEDSSDFLMFPLLYWPLTIFIFTSFKDWAKAFILFRKLHVQNPKPSALYQCNSLAVLYSSPALKPHSKFKCTLSKNKMAQTGEQVLGGEGFLKSTNDDFTNYEKSLSQWFRQKAHPVNKTACNTFWIPGMTIMLPVLGASDRTCFHGKENVLWARKLSAKKFSKLLVLLLLERQMASTGLAWRRNWPFGAGVVSGLLTVKFKVYRVR